MIPVEQVERIVQRKDSLRLQIQAARRELTDKAARSAAISLQVLALPEYAAAQTLMLYLSMPHEVQTGNLLLAAWDQHKQIAVPYLHKHEIALFRLHCLEELVPGVWDILAPRHELRVRSERQVSLEEVELVIAPGVAFDRRGGRLGHGRGYYDKFFHRIGQKTARIGLAFQCQMVDEVPMLPHDVFMHQVISEDNGHSVSR